MSEPGVRPLTAQDLPQVLAIEQTAYSHPWSQGHFVDALASGYHCVAWFEHEDLRAYLVAMPGVQETHLLNVTVAPEHQGKGLAKRLLQDWLDWSRTQGAQQLWLEVRESNARALLIYERAGFVRIHVRKDYYPLDRTRREHAVVMSLKLD
ncbi:ribosomal protein S18-alanine N-acetyltransferase [Limnohabitans sp.]|uniref:ribosomal protein S18-alanine N-acetyltransferase n=1 Tax=Limnohabitans sp. TaxID=1907725 RepID=UPI00311EF98F